MNRHVGGGVLSFYDPPASETPLEFRKREDPGSDVVRHDSGSRDGRDSDNRACAWHSLRAGDFAGAIVVSMRSSTEFFVKVMCSRWLYVHHFRLWGGDE